MFDSIRIKKGDTVVIVGLGKSGISAIHFCLAQGAHVKLSDASREHSQSTIDWLNSVNVEFELGGHSQSFFKSANYVLISPGVPHYLPIFDFVRSENIPVFGELALASQYLKTPLIAITGTNGKTTTTTLVGEILECSGKKVFVGGNIGTPLTDYLLGSQDADFVVLEVSSFQLDTALDFHPDIAVLLNITEDHLDRYEGFLDYSMSKFNLYRFQKLRDVSIYNCDDSNINALIENSNSFRQGWSDRRVLSFGIKAAADEYGTYAENFVMAVFDGGHYSFDLSGTVFEQFPNRENAAAAILTSLAAGCPAELILKALQDFKPLAHRMSLVSELRGVKFFNDSKATNIGAVQAALKAFDSPVILIAGGRNKGGDFSILKNDLTKKVKLLLLIGEAKNEMAEQFCGTTNIEMCSTLHDAVEKAQRASVSGDVVLFSPACASFDMFTSYVHRGEVFEQIVTDLAA